MQEAFFAVFFVALIFSVLSFAFMGDDLRRKSERSIYFMLITIAAWPVSLTLLIAPSTALAGPSSVTVGTVTVGVAYSTPFPVIGFYAYMAFSMGMTILFVVFLIKYMLEYGLQLFLDGLFRSNRAKS